ncbi:MAG: precorrin-6y C5,15-methyltransferase (decarboxylating) subunit CbiE [Methanobacterium sp.]|uniref:precorrin-6y C5,15-methyltransferase (decarboxylating) subunit CbiE n=1 Tax=Methanobacterium sp. TaxID=2164 RepID=UPI003D65BCCA|nr:precorrin-6y C5,15-methyltransferase (decarboxylating) subunit CbiE [Methanobacterium sp.]
MSKLYIVGIGPGSNDYLTEASRKAVKLSDVVIGSKRALDLFQKDEKIELNAQNMKDIMKQAINMVKDGKNVSILSTGDPGFSGILKPILKLNSNMDIEVIPGVSSVQLCAAKLKISWDEANIITLHGKGTSKHVLDVIGNGKPTMILPDFKPAELAQFLIENDVDPDRKVTICEKLSYDDEKVVETLLKNVLEMEFSYMGIMVLY